MAEKRVAQIAGHLFPKGMLSGQVAIITGSGQGIGAEAANLFAKEGAKVVVQDIDAGEPLSSRCINILQWKVRADSAFDEQPKQMPSQKLSTMPADKQQLCQVT